MTGLGKEETTPSPLALIIHNSTKPDNPWNENTEWIDKEDNSQRLLTP